MGISLMLLPTILAEERPNHDADGHPLKQEIRPPLPLERHSQTPAVLSMVAKGGGTEGENKQNPYGLIPM
jgi:hypothetical protein